MSIRARSLFLLAFPLGLLSNHSAMAQQKEVARNIAIKPAIKKATNPSTVKKADTTTSTTDSKPTDNTIIEYITAPRSKPKRKRKVVTQQKKKPKQKQQPPPKIVTTRIAPPFFNAIGFYVNFHFGFAKVNWKSIAPAITKNGDGGYSMGVSIGQRFGRNVGVEIGSFHLPRVTGPPNINTSDISVYLSWVGYVAVKLYAPVDQVGNLFLKLGVGDRYLRITNTAQSLSGGGGVLIPTDQTVRTHQIVPMFGVGGEYMLGNHYVLTVQYFYFQGRGRAGVPGLALPIPATHIFTIGFGVKFY